MKIRIASGKLVLFQLLRDADSTLIACIYRVEKHAAPDVNSDGQFDVDVDVDVGAVLSRDFLAEPAREFSHGVVIPLALGIHEVISRLTGHAGSNPHERPGGDLG
jgi:hypothetical protein